MSVWGILGLKSFFPHVATSGEYDGGPDPFIYLPGGHRYSSARHSARTKRIYDHGRHGAGGVRGKRAKESKKGGDQTADKAGSRA